MPDEHMHNMRLMKLGHACKHAGVSKTTPAEDPLKALPTFAYKLRSAALNSTFTFSEKLEDRHGAQTFGCQNEAARY